MKSEIQTSLEWQQARKKIITVLYKLNLDTETEHDACRTIILLDRLVTELSKEEINCRRNNKQTQKHKEILIQVNTHINEINRVITFASLYI